MSLSKCYSSLLDSMNAEIRIKKISPEYALKRLMLKLRLQYFGHLM